jgi:hypothetical protein
MVRIIAEKRAEEVKSSWSGPATGHSLGRHSGEEAGPPTMTKTEDVLTRAEQNHLARTSSNKISLAVPIGDSSCARMT